MEYSGKVAASSDLGKDLAFASVPFLFISPSLSLSTFLFSDTRKVSE